MNKLYTFIFFLLLPIVAVADNQGRVASASRDAATANIEGKEPMLQLTSDQPAKKVVGCILAQYKGPEFWADGVLADDGSIALQLFVPEIVTLAIISNHPNGSITRYLNVNNSNNKVIPRADIFDDAVNKCQSSP